MRTAGRWHFGFSVAMAALVIQPSLSSEAFAHDCVARIFDLGNLLLKPGAVVEDCMRTGWTQALVTALVGLIGGAWVARVVLGHMGGTRVPRVKADDVRKLVKEIAKKPHDFEEGVSNRFEGAVDEINKEFEKLNGGKLSAAEAERLRIRLTALMWALSQFVSNKEAYKANAVSPRLWESVSATPAGDREFKCNKLVADAYAHGAGLGLSLKEGEIGYPANPDGLSVWAPVADTVAKKGANLRNFTAARDVDAKGESDAIPAPGDLIAVPNTEGPGHSGHVGIYMGNGLIVAAKKDPGVTIESLQWEKRMHNNTARVRKYTGSGK